MSIPLVRLIRAFSTMAAAFLFLTQSAFSDCSRSAITARIREEVQAQGISGALSISVQKAQAVGVSDPLYLGFAVSRVEGSTSGMQAFLYGSDCSLIANGEPGTLAGLLLIGKTADLPKHAAEEVTRTILRAYFEVINPKLVELNRIRQLYALTYRLVEPVSQMSVLSDEMLTDALRNLSDPVARRAIARAFLRSFYFFKQAQPKWEQLDLSDLSGGIRFEIQSIQEHLQTQALRLGGRLGFGDNAILNLDLDAAGFDRVFENIRYVRTELFQLQENLGNSLILLNVYLDSMLHTLEGHRREAFQEPASPHPN